MLIYCDSVILIYFLDSVGPFNVRSMARMGAMQAAGDVPAFSDLTRLECRVKPLIRAAHNFKLADSLHLAAAVEGGCERFLTNDNRLAGYPGIAIELLA